VDALDALHHAGHKGVLGRISGSSIMVRRGQRRQPAAQGRWAQGLGPFRDVSRHLIGSAWDSPTPGFEVSKICGVGLAGVYRPGGLGVPNDEFVDLGWE
jgi:hypothetical protein